eukprot:gnl/TRDRNA2_/TRDRNA2_168365_c2_seq2.p1 gnl/TRDRNA2_/TRDRNA2_168365_c2~~gnl/TRDRNA2_/TRDRNA2_168365_c2_seq2.p1  ORF type:complete len:428 (+),score=84.29 gnl/TRDRNA2_/TRDRNA2_168365_c2_seq2:194-1285(+)
MHFIAEGSAPTLKTLRSLLESRLAEIHEEVKSRCEEEDDSIIFDNEKTATQGLKPSRGYRRIATVDGPSSRRDAIVLHIDELNMPGRPAVQATATDCEVWVDPLPDAEELKDWLAAWGEAVDVYHVPMQLAADSAKLQDRGYVRFKTHDMAKACVAAFAGVWSESERALSWEVPRRRQSHKILKAYPDSIIAALQGKGGEEFNDIQEAAGVRRLAFGGAVSQRLHFVAEGDAESVPKLRAELEDRLYVIHQNISKHLQELGDTWHADQESTPYEQDGQEDGMEESLPSWDRPRFSSDPEQRAPHWFSPGAQPLPSSAPSRAEYPEDEVLRQYPSRRSRQQAPTPTPPPRPTKKPRPLPRPPPR